MLNADAKAKSANAFTITQPIYELLRHGIRPDVGAGDRFREAVNVVASSPTPRNVSEVEIVRYPEIRERDQPVLVNSVPETQFGGDSVAEPVKNWQTVITFRSCR